uniref:transmembrane protein 222 isoform X3 n=1 Tax=Myxine glutinosa TaxID=7769 RepID=UPI00358E489E
MSLHTMAFADHWSHGHRHVIWNHPRLRWAIPRVGRQHGVWKSNQDPSRVVTSRTWDSAIHEASEEYKQRMHNLCCDNCHSHVAMALNLMCYDGRGSWGMVRLCFLMLLHGKHVSVCSFLKTWIPFLIAVSAALTVILVLKL